MAVITVSRIEILCLAKLVETAQLLDRSISDDARITLRLQLETLVRISGAAAVALRPGATEVPMEIGEADVATLRDLRLVFVALAVTLKASAETVLRDLAQILNDVLDRAEIATAHATKQAAGIPGAPEHG